MKLPPPITLYASQFLNLIREGHWEYVDRVNATGSALIVAVTAVGPTLREPAGAPR